MLRTADGGVLVATNHAAGVAAAISPRRADSISPRCKRTPFR